MAATKNDGISRVERAKMAQALRDKGYTTEEIARKLGIARSYTSALFSDPDGSKERLRKEKYKGTCVDCGGVTSYGHGKDPSQRCLACEKKRLRENRRWTRARIIADIRRWNEIHGRPPTATDWLYYTSPTRGGPREWPHVQVTQQEFGSWANAVVAAGFPRPTIGKYDRTTPEYLGKVTKWPKERIIERIREWEAIHGRPPTSWDWRYASNGYPNYSSVLKRFGSWADAIEAAGFPRPRGRWKHVQRYSLLGEDGKILPIEQRAKGVSLVSVVEELLGKEAGNG